MNDKFPWTLKRKQLHSECLSYSGLISCTPNTTKSIHAICIKKFQFQVVVDGSTSYLLHSKTILWTTKAPILFRPACQTSVVYEQIKRAWVNVSALAPQHSQVEYFRLTKLSQHAHHSRIFSLLLTRTPHSFLQNCSPSLWFND